MTFLISEDAIQEPSATTRLAPNQSFEKRFTFEGKALSATIELLILSTTPSFTHVSFNQTTHENVIRVSGDSEEIVGAVKVLPAGPTGLEIRVDERFETGHLLAEVLLAQPSQVKSVPCTGSAVVVLDGSVVTKDQSDSDLKISLTGNGDLGEIQLASPSVVVAEDVNIHTVDASRIKVFTSKLEATNINLSITGSGDFQVAAPSMGRTDALSRLVAKEKPSVSVTGAGDLDIFYPNVHAAELGASVTGSGDVRIAVRNEISASSLKYSVTDFGRIAIASRERSCNSQVISTIGHGQVDTGDARTVYHRMRTSSAMET